MLRDYKLILGGVNVDIVIGKPWTPKVEDLIEKFRPAVQNAMLTNNGPLLREFEDRLQRMWGVKNVIAVSNGTMAIQLALRGLGAEPGEVITTAYTWHATITAIIYEGHTPVMCDIDESSLCIDPEEVEKRITDKTVAIVPVNVYGNPPNFDALEKISQKTGIPVIYDAAHAAFTEYNGKNSFSYGMMSTTSFHATKLINTCEGGACITDDDDFAEKIRSLRYFGFLPDGKISDIGTNAKLTELGAAYGLCCLDSIDTILSKRSAIAEEYSDKISSMEGVKSLAYNSELFTPNNLYFPILSSSYSHAERIMQEMGKNGIICRRYFHPSMSEIEAFGQWDCPTSEYYSERVICLPIHTSMGDGDVQRVISVLGGVSN